MIIRPIAQSDLDALYQIAEESGPGFTSLMPDRDALARKIEHSVRSFERTVHTPEDEHYLFVLEDEDTGEIMGTTGIEAMAGHERPLIHFERHTVVHHSRDLGLRKRMETLTRCNHYRGCTEICSLYLRPAFRRANAGKLLSRVRFLFMAQEPGRFSDTVIAEMRGVSDEHGQSPFWNWLRQHFVDIEFASATRLVGAGYTGFIDELMPAHPLYTQLMSPEARAVIGEVHPQTRPALRMLEKEGFRHKGYVDLFDAGPTVECRRSEIRSVRLSRPSRVTVSDSVIALPDLTAPAPTIVAAGRGASFRATVTDQALADPTGQSVTVSGQVARSLRLDETQTAWILPLTSEAANAKAAPMDHIGKRHYAH